MSECLGWRFFSKIKFSLRVHTKHGGGGVDEKPKPTNNTNQQFEATEEESSRVTISNLTDPKYI